MKKQPMEEEHDESVDPTKWQDYQLDWFHRVFYGKDVYFFALYFIAFSLYTYYQEPLWTNHDTEENEDRDGMFVSASVRATATFIFAIIGAKTNIHS